MAILRDLHNNISVEPALDVAVITTDTTTAGDIIDTRSAEAVEFVIVSGTLTDGTYTPLVEDGDDSGLSDAAAVADADLLGTEADAAFAATDDNAVKKVGYAGSKRYVRLSLVSASTTTGGTIGAVALKRPLTRGTTG